MLDDYSRWQIPAPIAEWVRVNEDMVHQRLLIRMDVRCIIRLASSRIETGNGSEYTVDLLNQKCVKLDMGDPTIVIPRQIRVPVTTVWVYVRHMRRGLFCGRSTWYASCVVTLNLGCLPVSGTQER